MSFRAWLPSKLRHSICGWVLCGATLAGLAGCGLKIGENPGDPAAVELGSAQTACLSGASSTLRNYFNGKSTESQISHVFSCASNSLSLFKERTHGASDPDVYSPEELRKFLEEYFLNKKSDPKRLHISDALLNEAMELKKTLLGGNTKELTRGELDRLVELLNILRDVSIKLRPYLPLTPKTANKLTPEQLDTSISALEDAANSLGKVLEERATPYSFSHLQVLLAEMAKFLQDGPVAQDLVQDVDYVPLLRELKKIFISPDDTMMSGSDWRKLLVRGAKLYGIMLKAGQVIQQEPTLVSGEGRQKITKLTQQSLELIEGFIDDPATHPDKVISYCSLYSTLDRLGDLYGHHDNLEVLKKENFKGYPVELRKYLEDNIKENDADYLTYFTFPKFTGDDRFYLGTIKQLLQPLFQMFLRPLNDINHRVGDANGPRLPEYWKACQSVGDTDYNRYGLRSENLQRLWQLVESISDGQDFLERSFDWAGQFNGLNPPYIDQDYLSIDLTNPSLQVLYHTSEGSLPEPLVEAANMLRTAELDHLPFFRPHDPQMEFDDIYPVPHGQPNPWRQSFVDLSAMNGIRNLVKMVWNAYEPKGSVSALVDHGGLPVEDVERFYFDVKELGDSLKLFDPTVDTAARKRFLEGNLFTYASDGDHFLSVDEAQELVEFLFSSKVLSSRTYNLVYRECSKKPANIGGIDLYGKRKISKECYEKAAFDDLAQQLWDHMPYLKRWYFKLPSADTSDFHSDKVYRQTFGCLLEAVARSGCSDPKWIDSGDIDQISALEHYLEAVFVRFDQDRSDTLDREETDAAYPVLATTLKDTAKKMGINLISSDSAYRAVLEYLLQNGSVPSDLFDFLGVKWRQWVSSSVNADRAKVLQAIAVVINSDVSYCFTPDRQPPSRTDSCELQTTGVWTPKPKAMPATKSGTSVYPATPITPAPEFNGSGGSG